jgi:hypothetical protein
MKRTIDILLGGGPQVGTLRYDLQGRDCGIRPNRTSCLSRSSQACSVSDSKIGLSAGMSRQWAILHCAYFAFYSPYTVLMMWLPESYLCDFVVTCRRCLENIPVPIETMPDSWVQVKCPLCDLEYRYTPPEIFRGHLSHRLVILVIARNRTDKA